MFGHAPPGRGGQSKASASALPWHPPAPGSAASLGLFTVGVLETSISREGDVICEDTSQPLKLKRQL